MSAPSAPPQYPDLSNQLGKVNQPINVPIQHQPHTQQPQPMHTAIIQTRTEVRVCTSCQKPLRTKVGYRSTCITHVVFALCCISVCCTLCSPCVYCTSSCREPNSYCENCGEMVLV